MSQHAMLRYRPDIDGLRGIAVLLVVLFHGHIAFRGGFVGVDVFFVISGYLITMLMLRELESGAFRLGDFWERRIRRIFPALAVMTLITLAVGAVVLFPLDFARLGSSAVAQVLLISNVYFWKNSGGYFGGPAEEMPLLHTWSLAVEEQFYLAMPLLCLLVGAWWRRRPRPLSLQTACLLVFSCLMAASFVASVVMVRRDAHTAFFWLPTRAWELLLGSCLACLPVTAPWLRDRWRDLLAATALATILAAALIYKKTTVFPGLAALPPCLATAILIWVGGTGGDPGLVARSLAWKPLVTIGLMSYSLYLWHWPFLAFANYLHVGVTSDVPRWTRIVAVLVSFGVALASWRWVETPIRRRAWLDTRRSLFSVAAVTMAVTLVLGLWIGSGRTFPWIMATQAVAYAEAAAQMPAKRWPDEPESAFEDRLPTFGRTASRSSPRVLLWGDSHAKSLTPAVAAWCDRAGDIGMVAAHSAAVPAPGFYRRVRSGLNERSRPWAEAVIDIVRRHNIPDTILAAYWKECPGDRPREFSESLVESVRLLRSAGTRVWVVLDVPSQKFDVPKALALRERYPQCFADPRHSSTTLGEHRQANRVLEDLVPRLEEAGAVILDPASRLFSAEGRSILEADARALYGDSNHLTDAGAALLTPLFEPVFAP